MVLWTSRCSIKIKLHLAWLNAGADGRGIKAPHRRVKQTMRAMIEHERQKNDLSDDLRPELDSHRRVSPR